VVGVGKLLVLMATGSILFLKDIITKAFQASNCGYEIGNPNLFKT
jgi:hypothetical protein